MSNTDTDTDDEGTEAPPAEDGKAIKKLRERADQATRLEKENAFLRAGVDLTDKMAQRLFAAYSGDMTVEAIKAEAEDWGIAQAAAAAAPPDPTTGQQEARQRLAGGQAAGGQAPPPADPVDALWKGYAEDRRRGIPKEQAQMNGMAHVLAAASNGQKPFLFDEEAWLSERGMAGYDFRTKRT